MDWSPTEMQSAVGDLAKQIFKGAPDPWAALAESGFLELDDPLDLCTLLIAVGRNGARVPALETLVLGAPARAAFPDLPADAVLTGSLAEPGSRDPTRSTTEHRDGGLYGARSCVPAADRAVAAVIPARDGLYAVKLADCEVALSTGTNDDPLGALILEGTPAVKIGGPEAIGSWLDRVHVGLAALHLGLAREALIMTAKYVGQREQFGRKIGTFQAVSQRAADAWIDTQAMEVTLWQAAWRLSEGLDASREIAIARYWGAEGSHRVLAAAQHIHAGMGFDRDYPLHRYFLTSKQWEFAIGGASAQLERLGDLIAGS